MEFKRIVFESPNYMGTEVIVGLTEIDSPATFQNFLENAFSAFQDFVAERCEDEVVGDIADDSGNYDENDYIAEMKVIRENCYISSISDISESKALWYVGTDDYNSIDW